MSHVNLARQKQKTKTGGDVSYYLQVIPASEMFPETVVEVDDVNEALMLTFSEGTVFKSMWRRVKLRQGLGKPDSTALYESEKVVYYSKRTYAVAERRLQRLSRLALMMRSISNFFFHKYRNMDPMDIVVHIPDPKRLDPYSFRVGDLIAALGTTEYEKVVLCEVLRIPLMRQLHQLPPVDETDNAQRLVTYAERILRAEQFSTPEKPVPTEKRD